MLNFIGFLLVCGWWLVIGGLLELANNRPDDAYVRLFLAMVFFLVATGVGLVKSRRK